MQGMVSGIMVVAAFAVVAWAAGVVAVRLYRMSGRARPGGPGPGVPGEVSEADDA